MKTKTIENGNIKIWFDLEEEFMIVNKNEPLYDTIIDANLLQRKYSKILVEEIKEAGLLEIHRVFTDIDDSLQNQFDKLKVRELDKIFKEFNSSFKTHYKYHKNSNGLITIIFDKFDNYLEFKSNYFGTFFLKLFAFKVDIIKSEEKNESIRGLSGFLSKFSEDYLKIYLENSRFMKFSVSLRVK